MALLITIDKKSFSISALVFLTGILISHAVFSQAREDYQVKAVFVFNFTQFVEWPEDAFENTSSPLIIGILGENPFGTYLQETIANEKANNHPLVIRQALKLEEIKEFHILFINVSTPSRLKETIASLKGKPVLTISDASNFAKSGGVIRLYTEDKKIRVRINLPAAKENRLTISSKLLKLADVVESQKK